MSKQPSDASPTTAGIGFALYFVGTIVLNMRERDIKDIWPAAFMLVISAAALAMRIP